MKRFIATVSTNKIGSECQVEFTVDEEDLEGLTEMQRDEFLFREAQEALDGQYEIFWEEIGWEA